MNIIMLGAPGAGKGTISGKLNEKYGLPHISTGDIFRNNISKGTELGKLAKSYIDSGALVPDEVVINMMIDKLSSDECKNGYILDGFPRTIAQAEGLDEALLKSNSKIDFAIVVDADDDKIVERLSGRRVCSKCGETYHIVSLKPQKEGVCDKCGAELIQRKDDTEAVIKDRLNTYHEQTYPLIDYYTKKGIVHTVNGFDDLNVTLKNIEEFIK